MFITVHMGVFIGVFMGVFMGYSQRGFWPVSGWLGQINLPWGSVCFCTWGSKLGLLIYYGGGIRTVVGGACTTVSWGGGDQLYLGDQSLRPPLPTRRGVLGEGG
ncbi:hypothetical protein XENTR_v10024979 [Xenopus tropicalis]|nr:hypothetical protein XENTR_v10024979 [Xenopus tropicalis]